MRRSFDLCTMQSDFVHTYSNHGNKFIYNMTVRHVKCPQSIQLFMHGISFFLANAYAEPLEKTHDKIFLFKFSVMQVVGSGSILAVI
jgi:hypothetical protein